MFKKRYGTFPLCVLNYNPGTFDNYLFHFWDKYHIGVKHFSENPILILGVTLLYCVFHDSECFVRWKFRIKCISSQNITGACTVYHWGFSNCCMGFFRRTFTFLPRFNRSVFYSLFIHSKVCFDSLKEIIKKKQTTVLYWTRNTIKAKSLSTTYLIK